MFNIFKKEKQEPVTLPEVKVSNPVLITSTSDKYPITTNNSIVAEIHQTFYTEVDRLLETAKVKHSLQTNKQELIDKANRLKSLGFTGSKEVSISYNEECRLAKLVVDNTNKEKLIKAINYFSQKYPQYKFITEDSVKTICTKYGLIYGPSSKYIGDIPDENLKQIEQFKIDDMDKLFNISLYGRITYGNVSYETSRGYTTDKDYKINEQLFEIVAPVKDFDTKNMELRDFKLGVIPPKDPIVLKPVLYDKVKYYLIVTAWGLEASDPLVVNEKMN